MSPKRVLPFEFYNDVCAKNRMVAACGVKRLTISLRLDTIAALDTRTDRQTGGRTDRNSVNAINNEKLVMTGLAYCYYFC